MVVKMSILKLQDQIHTYYNSWTKNVIFLKKIHIYVYIYIYERNGRTNQN